MYFVEINSKKIRYLANSTCRTYKKLSLPWFSLYITLPSTSVQIIALFSSSRSISYIILIQDGVYLFKKIYGPLLCVCSYFIFIILFLLFLLFQFFFLSLIYSFVQLYTHPFIHSSNRNLLTPIIIQILLTH